MEFSSFERNFPPMPSDTHGLPSKEISCAVAGDPHPVHDLMILGAKDEKIWGFESVYPLIKW